MLTRTEIMLMIGNSPYMKYSVPITATAATPPEIVPSALSVPRNNIRAPKPVSAPTPVPMSGNRISVSLKNPYISPAPTPAPNNAPSAPTPKFVGPEESLAGTRAPAIAGRAIAAVAGIRGGGATAATGGGVAEIRSCAGAAADTGPDGATACAFKSPFALLVPSAPQTGQLIAYGTSLLTGSTSNLNFWPQSHCTLSSIMKTGDDIFILFHPLFKFKPNETSASKVPPSPRKSKSLKNDREFSLKAPNRCRTFRTVRAHGMWTYEPRQGRKAATVVCSTSAVVTLAFTIYDLRFTIGRKKPTRTRVVNRLS
jgi:hypothetical protein